MFSFSLNERNVYKQVSSVSTSPLNDAVFNLKFQSWQTYSISFLYCSSAIRISLNVRWLSLVAIFQGPRIISPWRILNVSQKKYTRWSSMFKVVFQKMCTRRVRQLGGPCIRAFLDFMLRVLSTSLSRGWLSTKWCKICPHASRYYPAGYIIMSRRKSYCIHVFFPMHHSSRVGNLQTHWFFVCQP